MATAKPNKTQLVRDILKKDPNASPVAVAKKLEAHGVKANYVSKIKYELAKVAAAGKPTTKKAPAKKPAVAKKQAAKPVSKKKPATTSSERVSLADLIKAKKLAAELGGVDKAKAMLDAVSKLD